MKSLFLLLALLGTPALAATDPLATVNAFHQALHQADQNAALAQLSETVLIYESGHVERSRAEYASHHLPADMAYSKEMTRMVLTTEQQLSGKLAVITQETETTGRYKDKDVHTMDVETTVLVQDNGNWRIQHVHWSSRKLK